MMAQYHRIRCPRCGRAIAAIPDLEGDKLQLVKHLTQRVAGKTPAPCDASERVVIRRKGGWRLER